MRKFGMLLLSLFITGKVLYAQGIEFQHKSFEEVCEMAEKEDKLIFIDFYTDWCGPCKQMAAGVFPLPEVGEYYNENFINLKLNAETEARDLARKYKVNAFPTYLFLNADGEIISRTTGSRNSEGFIEVGKEAVAASTSKYSYTRLNKLYPTKLQDEDFLKIYIEKMLDYKQSPGEAIDAYLSVQTSIKERDVDMMEYLLKYASYLLLGGKAEQVYHDNYDEYWDIATRAEEKQLEKIFISMCNNTKRLAYAKKDTGLMNIYFEAIASLDKEITKKVNYTQLKMDYALMAKDIPTYKNLAIAYVDSIIAAKDLEAIREEDQAYFLKIQGMYGEHPSGIQKNILEEMKAGKQARDISEKVLKVVGQFTSHVEKKKEYKMLNKWVAYTETLLPEDALVENAKANLMYAQGDSNEAIALKEKAIAKLDGNSKVKGKYESELTLMKNGESLN